MYFWIPTILYLQTAELIHGLEERRDSYIKLQQEGKKEVATFLSFEDFQDLEQIKKWTSTKVGFLLPF
jgi:hypothetical protein